MQLINKNWLLESKEAALIISREGTGNSVSAVLQSATDEIILTVQMLPDKLTSEDIPVDVDGYTTSPVLKIYGTYLALHKLFIGWNGSGRGNPDDIYRSLADMYWQKAQYYGAMINRDTVVASDTTEAVEDVSTTRYCVM